MYEITEVRMRDELPQFLKYVQNLWVGHKLFSTWMCVWILFALFQCFSSITISAFSNSFLKSCPSFLPVLNFQNVLRGTIRSCFSNSFSVCLSSAQIGLHRQRGDWGLHLLLSSCWGHRQVQLRKLILKMFLKASKRFLFPLFKWASTATEWGQFHDRAV